MARRRTIEEPPSRLAVWARRVALFSLAATLIAVIIVRSGALEIVPALSTPSGALVLAVLAILLAIGAAIVIWFEGVGGAKEAATALFIGLALIAYPCYLGVKGYRLPAIYDITTDPIDPPRFDAIARWRPRDANPIAYEGLYAAELQHAAYSDIEPDLTDSTPQEAYDAAMKVVIKRKWRIVDARPPQGSAVRPVDARASPGPALRPPRSRHQCRAGAQPDRRHRRRAGLAAETGARAGKTSAGGQGRARQAIGAGDRRRPVGQNGAARNQLLPMRQHRQPGGADQTRIEADIARFDDGRNVGCALAKPVQDRGFAAVPVLDQVLDVTLRIAHRVAVAGQINRLAALGELVQRGHVIAHGAVGRRHDGGRPAHDVIAGENQIGFFERERHMVRGVVRRCTR